jgi:hypothetical protein
MMKRRTLASAFLLATAALGPALGASPALADPWWADHGGERGRHGDDHRRVIAASGHAGDARPWRPVVIGPVAPPRAVIAVPGRVRHYHGVVIIRPHGHLYHGYGSYRADHDAYKWLALTAITLGVLDYLSVSQQRALEAAQIRATAAPVGEQIIWSDHGASGSVVATREGTSTSGRYCREFQQTVMIGGRSEQAYGTACQQPDGSWQVVQTQ